MTDQKLTDLLLLSIELEKSKRELERTIAKVKKRRENIRAILLKYQDVNYNEVLFVWKT